MSNFSKLNFDLKYLNILILIQGKLTDIKLDIYKKMGLMFSFFRPLGLFAITAAFAVFLLQQNLTKKIHKPELLIFLIFQTHGILELSKNISLNITLKHVENG